MTNPAAEDGVITLNAENQFNELNQPASVLRYRGFAVGRVKAVAGHPRVWGE